MMTWDLPVPVQRASTHARFFDHAGPSGHSRSCARPCCLPLSQRRRHPGYESLRGSMAGYVLPYRRFAAALTGDRARLGADVDRYSVIASDLHRLLVAGLPAHCERFWTLPMTVVSPDIAYRFFLRCSGRLAPRHAAFS